jgi:RimJ/RimL family protein N-acetyltransferase
VTPGAAPAIEPIRARRLLLDPLTAADAEDLAGLLAEPALREWLRATDVAGLRERFAAWEARASPDGRERWLNWVVREDGRALGWVQATVRGAVAEVGYAVLPAERGRGVAGEALGALVRRLLRDGAELVEAHIAEDNPASGRVAAAAGLRPGPRFEDGEVVWERRPP